MDLASLLAEVGKLEVDVSNARAGDPRLADLIARAGELQRQVEEARGLGQPLVPDGSGPRSANEQTAAHLEQALRSIASAAQAKK